jgi:hypothetical protein
MEIPNDLNKLLEQLKHVTRDAGRMSEPGSSSGYRPTAADIELFLSQYHFASGAVIEQIEISNEGVFECYLFAVATGNNDDVSLLAMCAE